MVVMSKREGKEKAEVIGDQKRKTFGKAVFSEMTVNPIIAQKCSVC